MDLLSYKKAPEGNYSENTSLSNKANSASPELKFHLASNTDANSYPRAELRETGNETNGFNVSLVYKPNSNSSSYVFETMMDKNGKYLPAYTKTEDLKESDTVSSGGTKTVSVDFTNRSTRMLFVGAGTADSTSNTALRGIAIIRNGAATGVLTGSSLNISMSGTTLTIKNNGSGTVRYVID